MKNIHQSIGIPIDMAIFLRVVARGNFVRASEDLGLTPSAISKAITRLEDRLGVRLLSRTTRNLSLTNEGTIYYKHAKDIATAIEQAEAETASSSKAPSGTLRITIAAALAKHQIVPLIPTFLALYPDIEIDLNITEQHVDIVKENCDIAIRPGTLIDSSLIGTKLAEAKRYICASESYISRYGKPLTPIDLQHHNCLTTSGFPSLSRWQFDINNEPFTMEINGKIKCDNTDLLLDLALAGKGIVRLLETVCGKALQKGSLIPLLEEYHQSENVPIWAVTPPGRLTLPRVRVFVDFLKERLRKNFWAH
ncbi:LysR family transcriptional regulator [Kiloniella majae]|uniref:LysR family transcriptional regulator n=1 Tax=Kiloniella majae TaxID=1938558 RepID=UPI000A2781A3|nr:LysR family transcriptional regulator [Kiloniella majae]